jgi:hypothetical protein
MEGNLDEIDSRVNEEIETMRFLDNLFSKTRIIIGIVGIVGLLITVVFLLKK